MAKKEQAGLEQPLAELLAVLFAAGEPLEKRRLAQALACSEELLSQRLEQLDKSLAQLGMPLQILLLGESCQLCSRQEYAEAIRSALNLRRGTPLSQAAMEVLAIIAYNQPVTKAFIEQVRGVDSGAVVNALVEKELVEEAGRLELPGRPISYRTTPVFLRSFGLCSLEELPAVEQEAHTE